MLGDMKMQTDDKALYDILYRICQKHRRNYPENSCDSRQMCLMWSTNDLPDIIDDTPPFDDIADAFGITIDWEEALDLYNMELDEAIIRINERKAIQTKQPRQLR